MPTVKILRGDFLEPLVYEHTDLASAGVRADAACALHSAHYSESGDSSEIVVDANAYYGNVVHERERCARLNERIPSAGFHVWLVTTNEGRKSYYVTRPENKPTHGTAVDVTDAPE